MKIMTQNKYRNGFFFLYLTLITVVTEANVSEPKNISGKSINEIVKQGVKIKLDINPILPKKADSKQLIEGDNAHIRFTVMDAETQQPVKGLHPSAWIERDNDQEKSLSCKERVNSYLQAKLAFQPEITLNAYYVLTLNDTASISVIDPLGGYSTSKLLTRVLLNSPGNDWVLSSDQKRLYVSTPKTKQVAVIDTEIWKVISFLPFSSTPTRLALQPDEKFLWVALEADKESKGFSGVSVIDTESLEPAKIIPTGSGYHELSFSEDSQIALVSNFKDQNISIIDIEKQLSVKTVSLNSAPQSISYSPQSKAFYIATEKNGVVVINSSTLSQVAKIKVDSNLKTIRFSPDGRWGIIVSQVENKVFIFDASDNRIVNTIEVKDKPDQVSFTDNFVYIRSTTKETVTLISLDGLKKGSGPSVTSFPGGQNAPNKIPGLLRTDAIAQTPEGSAVVVANPFDKTVYYYMEGMAAPMGSFKLFGRNPMAALIVDRSLRETVSGQYSSTVQLPPSGSYNVAVLLDSPAVYHCFKAQVAPNKKAKKGKQSIKIKYLTENFKLSPNENNRLKFKVFEEQNNKNITNLTDLQVLIFRVPGTWQKRIMVSPSNKDNYTVDLKVPSDGIYQVYIQSPSLKLTFENSPALTIHVNSTVVSSADERK